METRAKLPISPLEDDAVAEGENEMATEIRNLHLQMEVRFTPVCLLSVRLTLCPPADPHMPCPPFHLPGSRAGVVAGGTR